MAKYAEYDSAWCGNHEKLYMRKSKNQFLRSKFFSQKLRLIKFLWNWKIELATNAEYDSAWSAHHEKLYLTHQKINFKDRIFLSEIEVKKFLWNWKIQLAKNAEYDSASCANHEKLYLSISINQILTSKFFGQKLRWKKFPWTWKIQLGKNAEYDSAWCANHEKLYWSPSINQNLNRNFLIRNWGLKNFFEIGKWNWPNMQNITQRDALIAKTIFEHIKKSIFNIEIFWSEIEVKKITLKLENRIG